MRLVVDVRLWPHPKHPTGLWAVDFDDHSRIAVDVAWVLASEDKTLERIKGAAIKYSDTHPDGVLSSVVVDLSGMERRPK